MISASGRYVAFVSSATNLVPGDASTLADVFLRDLWTNTTTLVSATPAGTTGNARSHMPTISADGLVVAFTSLATNLAGISDSNGVDDVFVRDFRPGASQQVRMVSVSTTGTSSGNWFSQNAVLSADGRRVAFESEATNLTGHLSSQFSSNQVFLRDLETNTTSLVSVGMQQRRGNGRSFGPVFSADGQHLAFVSDANDLVTGNFPVRVPHVYVRHLNDSVTEIVSVSNAGVIGNGVSFKPSISADGRRVTFQSTSNNLTSVADTRDYSDVFVRDLVSRTTTLASFARSGSVPVMTHADSGNAVISGDGRYVAFTSMAPNLVADDRNSTQDVFLYDLETDRITLLSARSNSASSSGNALSEVPVMSFWDTANPAVNRPAVAFSSFASDLTADSDPNWARDVFLRDLSVASPATVLVSRRDASLTPEATPLGESRAVTTSVSADGRYVAFTSIAPNLTSVTLSKEFRVYVYDTQTEQIELISVSNAGVAATGYDPAISPDGRYVAFISVSRELAGGYSDVWDVYVRDRVARTTTKVSVGPGGVQANGSSQSPAIGVDSQGRWNVAFLSHASNLTTNDSNAAMDVFVRRQNAPTELVSVTPAGQSGNDASGSGSYINGSEYTGRPRISPDGRYLAFVSKASNLVANDGNAHQDVFVRDVVTGVTTLVSVGTSGNAGDRGAGSPSIGIDAEGYWRIAFVSNSTNLTANDTNFNQDVFVRDQRGVTIRASQRADGGGADRQSTDPVISGDGSRVVFLSEATNLTNHSDTNLARDVFVKELATGAVHLVTVGPAAPQATDRPFIPPLARMAATSPSQAWPATSQPTMSTGRLQTCSCATWRRPTRCSCRRRPTAPAATMRRGRPCSLAAASSPWSSTASPATLWDPIATAFRTSSWPASTG